MGIEIKSQSYNHYTSTKWKIVTGSSISGTNGNEIVPQVALQVFKVIKRYENL